MIANSSHSDSTGERRLHCALASLVGSVGLVLTGHLLIHGPVALIALTIADAGVLAASPVFWAIPSSFLRGTASAGSIAIINFFANLGGFVTPYAIGFLATRTGALSSGMYFSGALEFAGAVLVLTLFKARRRRAA
jgi:nitrate/nitrite transporter NarK